MNDMTHETLFDWFVAYHCERNLPECMQHVEDGVVRHPANNYKAVPEGKETKAHEGILVIKNGNTLLERLVSDGLVSRDDIDEPIPIESAEAMYSFLDSRKLDGEEDGVYIYESARKQLIRVSYVKPVNLIKNLSSRLPSDFTYSEGVDSPDLERSLRMNTGTKTRLALSITSNYPDVEAFQIKRSQYGGFGMGKVTHFDRHGLREEFFIESPSSGVYRRYDESINRVEETKGSTPAPARMSYC